MQTVEPGIAASHEPLDPEARDDLQRLVGLIEQDQVKEARTLARDLAEKWPDSAAIQHLAWVLEPPKVVRSRPGVSTPPFAQEYAWVRRHAREYPGRWLAVYGDQLIAAGLNIRTVREAARATLGEADPLFYYQPPQAS
jgi:hypothetical protein